MKLAAVGESLWERVLLFLGLVPTPLIDTLAALCLARTVMAGTKLGVFAALAGGARSSLEVAAACGTHPEGTARLLAALAGARYVRERRGRYHLTRLARRWLLSDHRSLHDSMLFRYVEWELMDGWEEYVRSGQGSDMHERFTRDAWAAYQRGMRSLASLAAPVVARHVAIPDDARTLLDVGGGHGHYAAELCRRHPQLRATVLDLPEALSEAEPLLAAEELGERLVPFPADARIAQLQPASFDVVLIVNLLHHFDGGTNRALVRRMAEALRPEGVLAIVEPARDPHGRATQLSALLDLYFAVTSTAGPWTADDLAAWQVSAGLTTQPTRRPRSMPGIVVQIGTKSRPAVPVAAADVPGELRQALGAEPAPV